MRGLARLTGHESCVRVDENYKLCSYRFALCSYRFNKTAHVSERFSDTQEKTQANDVQVITHNNNNKKNIYIITYHRQVTVGVMTRTVSSLTSVKKTKKTRSVDATSKNKEKKKDSRQLSCNSHCSFDRAMRVEETLMPTLIDSHPVSSIYIYME